RRYWHPLSHVPGPFVWSISHLPIWHQYVVKGGRLLHALPKLHDRYGPVVRISPNEVHLSDTTLYDTIYSVGTRFLKDPSFYTPMEGPVATPILLTVLSPDEHRWRRKMITPFFSRQSVLAVEAMVWDKANKFCDVMQSELDDASKTRPFDAYKALRAVAIDVITEYAYARCWHMLDRPADGYGIWYPEAIRSVQTMFPWLQTLPFLTPLFGALPDGAKIALFPPYKRWNDSLQAVRLAVDQVGAELARGSHPPRRTIIHHLMEPQEKGLRLDDAAVFADAVNVTGAGTETTGATQERAMYEVLRHPDVHASLVKELREAFPNPADMRWTLLEQLPVLNGVIKEALRLNPGVPGRLPRVVPPGGATFNGVYLPGGTIVSMSAWDMHNDPSVFPSPSAFDPYRWIQGTTTTAQQIRQREKYLVAFSRGSRGCVGQNLAMCELYCTIAAIFRRFDDLSLRVSSDFGPEDMEMTELVLGYHPNKRRFRV
ncbi:cytochrome P450, partial [Immersiella caudata]